jgi:hypothetical protein
VVVVAVVVLAMVLVVQVVAEMPEHLVQQVRLVLVVEAVVRQEHLILILVMLEALVLLF